MRRKAQGLMDYLFLLTIVVVVLLVMGYYIRNALSGKYREASDTIGQGDIFVPDVSGTDNPTTVTSTIENTKD